MPTRREVLLGLAAIPLLPNPMESAMKLSILKANDRGDADHGWLHSRHTFSFAGYYDPRRMGFSHLRVINEDRVDAGRGFGTHPHRDMEIVSYVIDGELGHRDTLGTGSVIRPGEVQLMSAGSGIAHSEMNPSPERPVHFLQIWILPAKAGTKPRYDQRDFGRDPGLRLVVSPDGRDGSLQIGQDTDIHRALLSAGTTTTLPLRHTRAWVQVVRGQLDVNGAQLRDGDAVAIEDASSIPLRADSEVEALIFDLR